VAIIDGVAISIINTIAYFYVFSFVNVIWIALLAPFHFLLGRLCLRAREQCDE
jgi:hypothetical protein